MQVIIIGAGRGIRLMPTTADTPKCFAEVVGRRILDWTLEAFEQNGIQRICFVGGYQIEKVRQSYPRLTYRENKNWQHNNILASLLCAEDVMDESFICCYSDILFTSTMVADLLACREDVALGVDTAWLDRYAHRSEHSTDDAEKVTAQNGQVRRIHRDIDDIDAYGEFIGVAKFSPAGSAALREHYHRCRTQYANQPFREAVAFEKAYLIHLLQEMIEAGQSMVHVDTPGGYIEVDTQQDFNYARRFWTTRHAKR